MQKYFQLAADGTYELNPAYGLELVATAEEVAAETGYISDTFRALVRDPETGHLYRWDLIYTGEDEEREYLPELTRITEGSKLSAVYLHYRK